MSRGKIIILSGPSGSGKTTLHKKLLLSKRLKGHLVASVSVTTRTRRSGERTGRDYLFISKKQFIYKKNAGHLLEWQKVFDNYYGTPKKNIASLLKKGKNVLLCIDVKGARVVRRLYRDAISIFIAAPSWNELKRRLIKRASETKETLDLRLKIARKEMEEAKYYDYIVVNDSVQKALKSLVTIICREIKGS